MSAAALGSPRVGGFLDEDSVHPVVVLVTGPTGIRKSRIIQSWCNKLNAMHISPKREIWKKYAEYAHTTLADIQSSPRRDYHFQRVEAYLRHVEKEGNPHLFDNVVRAQLRLFHKAVIFVDVVSVMQAEYYADFDPALVYISDADAESQLTAAHRWQLHLLKKAAISVIPAREPTFPFTDNYLQSYVNLRIPLFTARQLDEARIPEEELPLGFDV